MGCTVDVSFFVTLFAVFDSKGGHEKHECSRQTSDATRHTQTVRNNKILLTYIQDIFSLSWKIQNVIL